MVIQSGASPSAQCVYIGEVDEIRGSEVTLDEDALSRKIDASPQKSRTSFE